MQSCLRYRDYSNNNKLKLFLQLLLWILFSDTFFFLTSLKGSQGSERSSNTKCWWGYGVTGTHFLLAEMQNSVTTLKDSWWFLTKLKLLFPCDPAISLIGIYAKKLKTYPHNNFHNNFICKGQNLEETKISFSRWMDK